ncbi:MAG: site-specific integrase [Nitrospirae bacterium]|nr:site-specific integrase [Nitrospirota bacterium]
MAKSKGMFKRPASPYWWIRYTGADGKQKKESTKTTLKTEAEYLLSKRRKEAVEGIIPERNIKAAMFSALIQDYLVWAERQKAYVSKRNRVNQLLVEFGDIPLSSFSTKLVEQYQTKRLNESKKSRKKKKDENSQPEKPKAKIKPSTINHEIAILKHMFSKAVEWNMVSEEAAKNVKRVKLIPENNRRLRYLSSEECAALVNSCAPHLRPIVVTALNTGMRRGEIFRLTWDRVDLRHGFILLDTTKNGERREIPINGTLRVQLEELAFNNVEGHRHVFHDKQGRPYQDIKRSFHSACKAAGITDFHFHDLRHTFASHLVMAGVDITTVKELLGHKTLTMTLRYAHLAPSHKVKALEVLDTKLGQKDLQPATN